MSAVTNTTPAAPVLGATPASPITSLGKLSINAIRAQTADVSQKVIIIWQKSSISENCQKALATIKGGVHIWNPIIDGQKLDVDTFAVASYNVLILWAGDPASKTAAAEVHTWFVNNRKDIKARGILTYVIPKKFFSFAGLKSVYEDTATALKALPKWHPDLHQLLLNLEEKFPESEIGHLKALLVKLVSLVTKKE